MADQNLTSDTYSITPLDFSDGGFRLANTVFGEYSISTASYLEDLYGDDEGYEDHEFKHQLTYCFDEYYDEGGIGEYDTEKEAVEAANKHWQERISKCLTKI